MRCTLALAALCSACSLINQVPIGERDAGRLDAGLNPDAEGGLDGDGGLIDSGRPIDAGPPPEGVPLLRHPWNGYWSGSVLSEGAAAGIDALRPRLTWDPVPSADEYEVQISSACTVATRDACVFESAVTGRTNEVSWAPAALEVSRTAPVGMRYFWRVRACTTSGACSGWSEVRFLDVGRVQGDLNGDGRSEIIAGHREDVGGSTAAGRVRVYPGQAGSPGLAVATLDGTEAMSETGAALATGDLNGDGFADLMVGAPRQDSGGSPNSGRALLLLGSPSGVEPGAAIEIVSPSRQGGGLFATSLSAGCDFDADGYGDLAVGAPSESDGGTSGAGRAYLFYGGPSGLAARPAQAFRSPTPVMAGGFGTSVSLTADIDGDGRCDLVIGTRENPAGATSAGRAYVAYASRWDRLEVLESTSPEAGGLFSNRVVVGDVDGDGFGDVVAAAMNEDVPANQDAGIVYVFFGARSAPLARITLASPEARAFGGFGSQLAIGDVTGDGATDILVFGLQETSAGLPVRAGRVHVFAGGSRSPSAVTLMNAPSAIGFGAAMGASADSNGDGIADIAIGSSSGGYWLPGSAVLESTSPTPIGPTGPSIAALAP